MTLRPLATLIATAGALAYAIAKLDLARRGELGMPGFTAPADSYQTYDPVSGQLSNTAVGVIIAVVIMILLRLPQKRPIRWVIIGINIVSALMITAGVIGFLLRATGVAPQLGTPAEGPATWLTLLIGAVWVVSWSVAIVTTVRHRQPQKV